MDSFENVFEISLLKADNIMGHFFTDVWTICACAVLLMLCFTGPIESLPSILDIRDLFLSPSDLEKGPSVSLPLHHTTTTTSSTTSLLTSSSSSATSSLLPTLMALNIRPSVAIYRMNKQFLPSPSRPTRPRRAYSDSGARSGSKLREVVGLGSLSEGDGEGQEGEDKDDMESLESMSGSEEESVERRNRTRVMTV